MTEVYKKLFDTPAIAGMVIEPDETEDRPHKDRVCENWWHAHLEPRKLMRKNQKILVEFFNSLELLGRIGELRDEKLFVSKVILKESKFNKPKILKLIDALKALGVKIYEEIDSLTIWSDKYPSICNGWKLLSEVSGANVEYDAFSRSVFNVPDDDIYDILFKHLEGETGKLIKKFITFIEANGFTLDRKICNVSRISFENLDIRFSKDYLNHDGKTAMKLLFTCSYVFRDYNQLNFNFMSGKDPFILLHKRFDELSPNLQDFVVKYSGECDACGSCIVNKAVIQRKNPFSYITVDYKGRKANLCHVYKSLDMYSGYQRNQKYTLDEKFITDVMELYKFFEDNILTKKV
jgi:hypothetical protein